MAEGRRVFELGALLALLAAACSPAGTARDRDGELLPIDSPVALVSVTVVDGRGGAPLPDRTILTLGERIVAVFPTGTRPLPRGTLSIPLAGHFVIPGLIDSHVHLGTRPRDPATSEALLRHALLGGVTTVRDMGGNGPVVAALAERSRSGEIAAPDIVYAALVTGPDSVFWTDGEVGAFVAGDRPRGEAPWWGRLRDARDVSAFVANARAHGASGIKIHSGLSPALLAAVGREARRARLRVWSHGAVTPALPQDAVAAGVETLSHADMLAFTGLQSMPPAPRIEDYRSAAHAAVRGTAPDGPAVTRLLAAMRRRGTILEPTLFIVDVGPDADPATRDRVLDHQRFAFAVTRRANAAGVAIAAGSDALGGSSPNIHAELQLLVRAGLTPLQAITAATATGARAAGVERDRGVIAPGMRADLVILCRDPSRDVRNTLAVLAVVRSGRPHARTGPLPTPPRAEAPPTGAACPAPADEGARRHFPGGG